MKNLAPNFARVGYIRTLSNCYEMRQLKPRVNGNRWAVSVSHSRNNTGRDYKLVSIEYFPNKSAAIEYAVKIINPVTLALFEGLCLDHTGKMKNVISFSTLCTVNPHCIERMKNRNAICAHCFAARGMEYKHGLENKLSRNTATITKTIYSETYFPIINGLTKLFRFESFGDLNNAIQAHNYLTWACVNRRAHCALWTKNPWYLQEAVNNGAEKPQNLNVIHSSTVINTCEKNIPNLYSKGLIDKIFTVYDNEETAKSKGVKINCAARNCATCKRCYTKRAGTYVNELLK